MVIILLIVWNRRRRVLWVLCCVFVDSFCQHNNITRHKVKISMIVVVMVRNDTRLFVEWFGESTIDAIMELHRGVVEFKVWVPMSTEDLCNCVVMTTEYLFVEMSIRWQTLQLLSSAVIARQSLVLYITRSWWYVKVSFFLKRNTSCSICPQINPPSMISHKCQREIQEPCTRQISTQNISCCVISVSYLWSISWLMYTLTFSSVPLQAISHEALKNSPLNLLTPSAASCIRAFPWRIGQGSCLC